MHGPHIPASHCATLCVFQGALLQATATYMMTPEAQGYCTALGILPVSSSLATAATT